MYTASMKYKLFLFDLDDTLLDFKSSERRSFHVSMQSLGINQDLESLFTHYQRENTALWQQLENAQITKEILKVERFRRILKANGYEVDPNLASERYLEALPENVVLMDYAQELCQWLSEFGEIGIITNGLQSVQRARIDNSPLAPFISFISVSDECGHAKPDTRFFEYSVKKAKSFSKEKTLMVGDRFEADIIGAQNFGIDSCWFNPSQKPLPSGPPPTFEIKHLKELNAHLTRVDPRLCS